ncbi:hypothetical protein EBU71_01165 [bacterium]|nr:hypothetical protein [Candidatus Elulimicrobium humile]
MHKLLLLSCILSLFSYSASYAQKQIAPEGFYFDVIPTICAPTTQLYDHIISQGWKEKFAYVGKQDANPNGNPIFLVSHFTKLINGKESILSVISVPDGESCIVYTAFDRSNR